MYTHTHTHTLPEMFLYILITTRGVIQILPHCVEESGNEPAQGSVTFLCEKLDDEYFRLCIAPLTTTQFCRCGKWQKVVTDHFSWSWPRKRSLVIHVSQHWHRVPRKPRTEFPVIFTSRHLWTFSTIWKYKNYSQLLVCPPELAHGQIVLCTFSVVSRVFQGQG